MFRIVQSCPDLSSTNSWLTTNIVFLFSEPMLSLASQQPLPPTSYNLPTSYSTAAMNMGLTSVNAGIDDIMEKDLLYNSLSMEPEPLMAPMAGPSAGPTGRAVDMLEIPGTM